MRTNRSGQSALLLLDAVDLLGKKKIDYAVVGALAASIHGTVRASMDADLVLSLAMPEATNLEREFRAAGFRAEMSRGDFADPVPGVLALSDRYGNRVDLLIGLRGLEAQAFLRAIDVPFQGSTLKFIGREDFIAMKLFAGGPIDLVDAECAFAAAQSIDLDLLHRLASKYGRDTRSALERLLGQDQAADHSQSPTVPRSKDRGNDNDFGL